ncbi:protein kinase [Coemansia spiralis]|uniref:Protein kinase n=1 Tax=Coemansia spiralis TaxID=417178 RepID=A0A9W8GDS4_9FUNG|nr:protein kinase [Coemansia spiralis]
MTHIDSSLPPAIEEDESAGVVNFTDFEHQKENIQPLRRGRSATALSLLYGKTPQPSRPLPMNQDTLRLSAHLQAQNAQYQAEISSLDLTETDDPLDVYFRYIQWLIEVFPQAVGHQAVIKLVERPIRLFGEQERYRNDSRYLRMWIWYCGLVNEGQEAVFQYLLAQRIGDSLALLYEEFGRYLESRDKVKRADDVYQLGIARKAQPLARLERRYEEFQKRVVARTVRPGEPPVEENTQRTMLGTKRGPVRSVAANTLPGALRGVAAECVRTNARIPVFSDPDGSAAPASAPTPWADVGSDESRRKENLRDASTWRGQTLEQRRVAPAAEGKFTVFSDSPEPSTLSESSGAKPKPRAERMVMPDSILFPAGDGIPQCAEEARARLPRYRFDYDAWVASLQPVPARRALAASPTINTRAAEQGMLDIWNDLSDSDSESLPEDRPPAGDRPVSAGCLADDDYQFTMGPVVPHIVPVDVAHRPPIIPTSVRVARHHDAGLDEAPTVVLNSIRAAKRQEMRLNRGPLGPTPLAMRAQTPVMARSGAAQGAHPAPLLFGAARQAQTPGYTRTATGFSVSGAELTGLSGFTGVSTIGGPTSLLTEAPYSTDSEDEHERLEGVAATPLRKRLSMAARDFSNMTPRFPKTDPGEEPHDDDDDDDDEDEDDDPCTENIGEFADLDTQMHELEMQRALGTRTTFHVFEDSASDDDTGRPAPKFAIFQD